MDPIRYATAGGHHVAYQVISDEGPDLVLVADWFGNVELMWEGPALSRALERLASFSRLIVFDKRGVGLSDPVPVHDLPTLEEWIDDVRAVMDDAEVKSAVLVGAGAGGPMVTQFAATHPHRVESLVLINTYARLSRAEDYAAGVPDVVRDRILAVSYTERAAADTLAGSSADDAFRTWWPRYQRQAVSPGTAETMRRMMFDVDVRSALGSVHVPTLVLHRRDNPWIRVGHGRYLADHIPAARLVELPGDEDLFFLGDTERLLDEVELFVTGTPSSGGGDRMLATLLMTDVVGSTAMASELGDRRWRLLLDQHDSVVRAVAERNRGRLANHTGDGVLAVFDGPGRAIRAATGMRQELAKLGLSIRAGIHTGEVERRGSDVTGIAVHLAARVAALAGPDEILVSSTVRDLVSGSGLAFADAGRHRLKGVPGEWLLLRVT